jgi:hypothetical protein
VVLPKYSVAIGMDRSNGQAGFVIVVKVNWMLEKVGREKTPIDSLTKNVVRRLKHQWAITMNASSALSTAIFLTSNSTL